MTEQQTPDRKKKIAEIRKWHDGGIEKFPPITVFEAIGFMLDELAEERAAHNAHVTELCELEKENRRLREERDKWEKEARLQYRLSNEMIEDIRTYREQLQSAQQGIERLGNLARQERELADHWMRKHHDDVVKLREEREKMIEGLRWYGRDEQYTIPHVGCSPRVNADRGQRARDILKEIGVTVE